MLELATLAPVGSKATEYTSSGCPRNTARALPVRASQSLTVPSRLELATTLPSGENSASRTSA